MMIAIVKRFWPHCLIMAMILGALYTAYTHGARTTNMKWEAKYNAAISEANRILAAAQARARALEQSAVKEQAAIESIYLQRMANVQSKTDRIIDDLRAGRIRLRDEFQHTSTDDMSSVASSATSRDAAGCGGLHRDHAAFLVQYAARAQATAEQLIAAQQLIILDRKICDAK